MHKSIKNNFNSTSFGGKPSTYQNNLSFAKMYLKNYVNEQSNMPGGKVRNNSMFNSTQ